MVNTKTMAKMRETFKSLEQILSQTGYAEILVNSTLGFAELFSKEYKRLGTLEKEWILEVPNAFNSQDAIRSVIERIDLVEFGVENGFRAKVGDFADKAQRNQVYSVRCL